jgi:hypothetical protein
MIPEARVLLNRLARIALLGWLAIAAAGVSLRAMSVVPPTFSELVAKANQILRVEVLEMKSQFDLGPAGERSINTYVKCRVLRTLKGVDQPVITLRQLGGEVGDVGLRVPGMPAFELGGRYIVFVDQNGTAICPLVAAMHGHYPVVKDDTAAGTERVLRSDGQPLTDVAEVVRPMSDHTQLGKNQATLISALSVADFEEAILRELVVHEKQL